MNVASVTVSAMIHGLTAGRHSAASFMVMVAAPIIYLNLCFELIELSGAGTRFKSLCSMSQRLMSQCYLIHTFGTTDMPGRSSWFLISPFSNTIFTGMRCTTFT